MAVGAESGLPQAHHVGRAHGTLQLLHQQARHTCFLIHPLVHSSGYHIYANYLDLF